MYSICRYVFNMCESRTFTLVTVLQDTALADWPVRLPSDSFIACLMCFQIAWILAAHGARIVALYILRNGDTRASVIRKGPYIPIDPGVGGGSAAPEGGEEAAVRLQRAGRRQQCGSGGRGGGSSVALELGRGVGCSAVLEAGEETVRRRDAFAVF